MSEGHKIIQKMYKTSTTASIREGPRQIQKQHGHLSEKCEVEEENAND